MTDAELEAHIKTCGRLMEAAMVRGDRKAAQGWLTDMNHAIASRSPEQVARLELEYFGYQGEACRLAGINTELAE